ncbi:hypothetical protein EX428_04940, partial [Salmonella enterica]|nr:hypothetical protein [Salmonella enterica]
YSYRKLLIPAFSDKSPVYRRFFTVSAASLNSDSSLSEIKLSPIPDTCKLLKVNKKMPLVSPHF